MQFPLFSVTGALVFHVFFLLFDIFVVPRFDLWLSVVFRVVGGFLSDRLFACGGVSLVSSAMGEFA